LPLRAVTALAASASEQPLRLSQPTYDGTIKISGHEISLHNIIIIGSSIIRGFIVRLLQRSDALQSYPYREQTQKAKQQRES